MIRSDQRHHQHPRVPVRPGQAPVQAVPQQLPRHVHRRAQVAGHGFPAAGHERTARGQRPQAGAGRRRTAGPGPHGRDVHGRAGLSDAPLPQPRPGLLRAFAGAAVGDGARPRRHPGDLHEPQQGLLPAGLDSGDRAVLQPRSDAARLRRAHVSPSDHAGGVHPQPVGRLCHTGRQGGLRRRRQRLGGQRCPVPALPGDEGADPRHRLGGVHGSRARQRQGTGDQGERGVHHHHAGRKRHHPHRSAAVHMVARTEGPQAPRTLLRGPGR